MKKISLAAPASCLSDANDVIQAGADEIYCGVLTSHNLINRPDIFTINRRAGAYSNFANFKSIKKLVRIAHTQRVKVSFALNDFYSSNQLPEAITQLKKAIDCGVDNIIIADIGLLHYICSHSIKGFDIHISSVASIFNSPSIDFYMEFNPSRIILQRAFCLDEIRRISQNFPKVNFEVFLMKERCYFIDGYCGFIHNSFLSKKNALEIIMNNEVISRFIRGLIPRSIMLKSLYRGIEKVLPCNFSFYNSEDKSEKHIFNTAHSFMNACALCNIPDFLEMGIKHFKVSGRSRQINNIFEIKMIKEAGRLINTGISVEYYEEAMKKLLVNNGYSCSKELCYYSRKTII